jgi:hypothetical protein
MCSSVCLMIILRTPTSQTRQTVTDEYRYFPVVCRNNGSVSERIIQLHTVIGSNTLYRHSSMSPCYTHEAHKRVYVGNYVSYLFSGGTRWCHWLRRCFTSRVRFPMVSLEFFIGIILTATLTALGSIGLQQTRVPGIFPGG